MENDGRFVRQVLSAWWTELSFSFDQSIDLFYRYVELPLQKICSSHLTLLSCLSSTRHRWLMDSFKSFSTALVQSFFFTWIFYFVFFFIAQMIFETMQRVYFLDPFLSSTGHCVQINLVRHSSFDRTLLDVHQQLNDDFLRQYSIVEKKFVDDRHIDLLPLIDFLSRIDDSYWMLCQRSLYLYTRFQSYSRLLNSNSSFYRFHLEQSSATFAFDRPTFVDLCLHAENRTHRDQLIERLLPISSVYYPSVNLFFFDFNFTRVSLSIYQLDENSPHLERLSVHTGWFYDLYRQFQSFKYQRALSTVLFDGLARGENFVTFFQNISIPLPSDPLLALNEMVQQALIVLPICIS